MEKYSLYCTEEQTKKAIKLGAPIQYASIIDIRLNRFVNADKEYALPTTEQMIGWLEEQGLFISIDKTNDGCFYLSDLYDKEYDYISGCGNNRHLSRKEATIAAIDAALEYLENLKH